MPKLEITGFDGVIPRMSSTMLADNQAQTANNVKLYSRELRFWRGPSLIYNPATVSPVSLYRLYGAADNRWLTWATDVDVAPGPLADTSDYRIYYTGDSHPRKTNWSLASSGGGPYPAAYYKMGVPKPPGAPAVVLHGSGASVGTEARAYVYTWVNTFGGITEESAPSDAAAISVTAANSVDVTRGVAPTTELNLTAWRIYRTVTGGTSSDYEFVAEVAIGTTVHTDDLLVAALGDVLGTIGWAEPPSDLAGLVPLPCGSLAGFSGNTVYFSEPFFAHAWPVAYALSFPYNIIGLGVVGNSVVVMTDRYPFVIDGPYPGAYSVTEVPMLEPCVSKQSIASDEIGVVYASPNGLIGLGPTMRGQLTQALFRRDEWQLTNPTLIKGAIYDGKYFACYPSLTDGDTMILSRDDIPALSFLEVQATAVYVDSRTATFFYINGVDDSVYQLDADSVNPFSYAWLSKRFILPQAISWSALRLDADYSQITADADYDANVAAIQAENAVIYAAGLNGSLNENLLDEFEINGDALLPVPTISGTRFAQVHIYGDGVLQTVLSMVSIDPVRVPAFRAREIEIKIIGTISVRSVALATSVLELRTQ